MFAIGNGRNDDVGKGFHQIFCVFPVPCHDHLGRRSTLKVPTDFLRQIIAEHLHVAKAADQLALLAKFAPMPALAGLVFEALMSSVLAPEVCPAGAQANPLEAEFLDATTGTIPRSLIRFDLPFDTSNLSNAELDTYYVPKINFPSIDAFFVRLGPNFVKEAFLLQATVGETHPVKKSGILRVKSLVGPDATFYYIFVVPNGTVGMNLVTSATGGTGRIQIGRGAQRTSIKLGWLVLHLDDAYSVRIENCTNRSALTTSRNRRSAPFDLTASLLRRRSTMTRRWRTSVERRTTLARRLTQPRDAVYAVRCCNLWTVTQFVCWLGALESRDLSAGANADLELNVERSRSLTTCLR